MHQDGSSSKPELTFIAFQEIRQCPIHEYLYSCIIAKAIDVPYSISDNKGNKNQAGKKPDACIGLSHDEPDIPGIKIPEYKSENSIKKAVISCEPGYYKSNQWLYYINTFGSAGIKCIQQIIQAHS